MNALQVFEKEKNLQEVQHEKEIRNHIVEYLHVYIGMDGIVVF